MRNPRSILILLVLILLPIIGYCQEKDWEEYFERKPRRHAISFINGYVVIPNSFEHELELESKVFFVGMIGLDYKYFWTHRLNTGLIYELELGQYFIQDAGSPVPRENVQVFTLFAAYEILPGFEIFAGPGYEYEVHKDYFIFKAGLEYEGLIANDWYYAPEVSYNYKEAYESIVVCFHLRKKFGKILKE